MHLIQVAVDLTQDPVVTETQDPVVTESLRCWRRIVIQSLLIWDSDAGSMSSRYWSEMDDAKSLSSIQTLQNPSLKREKFLPLILSLTDAGHGICPVISHHTSNTIVSVCHPTQDTMYPVVAILFSIFQVSLVDILFKCTVQLQTYLGSTVSSFCRAILILTVSDSVHFRILNISS